jgi:hypothetical protein
MRIVFKIPAAVALLALVAYGFDDLYARLRHEPYADVKIERMLATEQKFNQVGYERIDPVTERCVYALFPHAGHNPCWYVMRHTSRIINIG